MTAADLDRWLTERGLSNYRLAKILRRDERTVGRWRNGEVDCPPDLHLTLSGVDLALAAGRTPPDR